MKETNEFGCELPDEGKLSAEAAGTIAPKMEKTIGGWYFLPFQNREPSHRKRNESRDLLKRFTQAPQSVIDRQKVCN